MRPTLVLATDPGKGAGATFATLHPIANTREALRAAIIGRWSWKTQLSLIHGGMEKCARASEQAYRDLVAKLGPYKFGADGEQRAGELPTWFPELIVARLEGQFIAPMTGKDKKGKAGPRSVLGPALSAGCWHPLAYYLERTLGIPVQVETVMANEWRAVYGITQNDRDQAKREAIQHARMLLGDDYPLTVDESEAVLMALLSPFQFNPMRR